MRIIFIIDLNDDIYFLKTIFELGRWLKEERGVEIILYLPEIKRFTLLPQHVLEIRWLEKDLNPAELPEADIIISTNPGLAGEINGLSRGRVYYLKNRVGEEDPPPAGVRVIDFHRLRPGLPERLFQLKGGKRDQIILAGEGLNEENLSELLEVLEKAASSTLLNDVLILDLPPRVILDTRLNYRFSAGEEAEIIPLLEKCFFLIWVSKDRYPVLPLWAMAAGVLVIHINLTERRFDFPVEYTGIHPLELILNLLKLYKLGGLRNRISDESAAIARKSRLEQAGEEWFQYFEEELVLPGSRENDFARPLLDKSETASTEAAEVDLIIINYNTLGHLKKCLQSVREYTERSCQIIVVDNGSTDGSGQYLRSQSGLLLIENRENQGYARACNQGILAGQGKYIVLLNSDVELSKGWLEPLLKIARQDDVAVVGPKLVNPAGEIVGAGVVELTGSSKPRGWKIPDSPGVFDRTEDVLSVGGACYLIKRQLLPVLGLFDEGYFFYFEELDYSLRAREKGYRVVYCPETTVIHHHEGSLQEGDYLGRKQRDNYFNESRKRFNHKWKEVLAGAEKRREPGKIIVCGLIPWDFRQQRPQHLIKNLARLNYEVLYLNPVCGQTPLREVGANVRVWSPPGYGTVLYNLKAGNEISLGRSINERLRSLGFENSILLLDAPYWIPLVKFWEYSLLVYDCLDFYTEFEDLSREKEWILQAENELLAMADLVLTPSLELYRMVEEKNGHACYLPNAVEIEHFDYRKPPAKRPEDLPDYSEIVGYYGAISSWFDVELTAELAAGLPEAGFVLIGEISTDVSRLQQLPNVILLGEKPYQQLPSYLAWFDLTLLPFRINKLTTASDPVKTYEYLAGGKPVVATALPQLERFREIITITETREEFISRVKALLAREEDPLLQEKRLQAVEGETWRARAQELKNLFQHAYYGLYPQEGALETLTGSMAADERKLSEAGFELPGEVWSGELSGDDDDEERREGPEEGVIETEGKGRGKGSGGAAGKYPEKDRGEKAGEETGGSRIEGEEPDRPDYPGRGDRERDNIQPDGLWFEQGATPGDEPAELEINLETESGATNWWKRLKSWFKGELNEGGS